MRTSVPPDHAVTVISQQTDDLNSRADKYTNQKNPTVPMYDLPENPPAAAIEGQLAVDLNGKLWWFINDEWRTC